MVFGDVRSGSQNQFTWSLWTTVTATATATATAEGDVSPRSSRGHVRRGGPPGFASPPRPVGTRSSAEGGASELDMQDTCKLEMIDEVLPNVD